MSEITKAIQAICDEKNLDYNVVMETIEAALAAAYRKDFGNRQQNIKVKFDPETMGMQVWDVKEVVKNIDPEELEKAQEELSARREAAKEEGRELSEEEIADLPRFNPKNQMMLAEAREIDKKCKVGQILEIKLEVPSAFGRMAAQTAKQVVIQKLREAERNNVFDDLKKQEGEMVQGTIQRRDRTGVVIVDLGKTTGILPQNEQLERENYRPGARMRFFIEAVNMGVRGLEVILSRSSKKMVESVFFQEIPEVGSGVVAIKAIARDPGNRSKVAVFTADDSIDPIGACIGQRGSRINTIIEELAGEKIDVIKWSDNASDFIKSALSPAKVMSVELNEAMKEAVAKVAPDQFSLAIGRGGQNVRLAADLTGWKIKVVEDSTGVVVSSDEAVDAEVAVEAASGAEEKVSTEEASTEETKTE
ncbi:MAG TPA: transcription termination factor NusA [Candidatus Magasanikbacteria bacterium]|nr:transcription termination factor NusA [Candidatus Magasanikbacteria bacterium]